MVIQEITEKSKCDLRFEAEISLEDGIRKIYDTTLNYHWRIDFYGL